MSKEGTVSPPVEPPVGSRSLVDHDHDDRQITTAKSVKFSSSGISPSDEPRSQSMGRRDQSGKTYHVSNERDRRGRISSRDINFGIPSNLAAREHLEEKHGSDHWKTKCLQFVHKRWVQKSLLALLVADILILFTETFLLAAYPHCNIIVRDCIACCHIENGVRDRRLTEEDICEAGYDQTGEATCDGHKWHGAHTTEEILFFCTVSILFVFFVQNVVEMLALGPCTFFRQLFYAFDFFIVTVSLALELTFHYLDDDYLYALTGFLICFRLWRFVRIGHGLIEVTAELTHEQYEDLKEYARHCEEQLLARNLELPATTEKVKKMCSEVEE